VASTTPALAAPAPTSAPVAPHTARGDNDHVLYWNTVVLDIFRQHGGTPGPLTRGAAMMDLAIYDAVNSIGDIGEPYLVKRDYAQGVTGALNTAIDYAAYTTLRSAFPDYPRADLDAKLQTALSMPDVGTANERTIGRLLGTTTARTMISHRTGDGSTNTTPYVPTVAPGHWRPAPGAGAGAPNWGGVKPFALKSGSQFRPGPPGGFATAEEMLASPEYAAQVNEIKEIGGKHSTVRTAEQTEIAHYWANDLDGTYKPVGQQFDHTIEIYRQHRPNGDSFDSARLFALTSATLADAAIAIWDSKYATDWDLWRPAHAITLADQAPNPWIVADPTWEPLSKNHAGVSFSPSFPAYVSGHSGVVAAWAGAMENFFGRDDLAFSGGTDDPYAKGVTRSFPSFSAAAQEKADSRKYLGVHFEWDNSAGLALGSRVADEVYASILN
ncbi:vanadium-dependent haloperoxidase, partial [Streptomyces calidiresistens]